MTKNRWTTNPIMKVTNLQSNLTIPQLVQYHAIPENLEKIANWTQYIVRHMKNLVSSIVERTWYSSRQEWRSRWHEHGPKAWRGCHQWQHQRVQYRRETSWLELNRFRWVGIFDRLRFMKFDVREWILIFLRFFILRTSRVASSESFRGIKGNKQETRMKSFCRARPTKMQELWNLLVGCMAGT